MFHYQVIKRVLQAFRGLPERLSEITGLTADWYASHGRPPRSLNPQGTGNKWEAVEGFYEAVELYENGMKGAGVLLAEEIAADVRAHYGDPLTEYDDRQLVNNCIKEHSEAILKLNACDFKKMNLVQLQEARAELFQSIEAETITLETLDKIILQRFEEREKVDIYRDVFVSETGNRRFGR